MAYKSEDHRWLEEEITRELGEVLSNYVKYFNLPVTSMYIDPKERRTLRKLISNLSLRIMLIVRQNIE